MHIDTPAHTKFHWIVILLGGILCLSSPLQAQTVTSTDGIHRKGVVVQRIRPDDLPSPKESEIPQVLQGNPPLPRAPTLNEMIAVRSLVMPQIVQIVAIYKPKSALQRHQTMVIGNAVWLSGDKGGQNPVLVTPFHWLKDATAIYALPWDEHQLSAEDEDLPRAKVLRMSEAVQHDQVRTFFKTATKRVQLTQIHPDEHRNLVTLQVDAEALKKLKKKQSSNRHKNGIETDWFKPPKKGLEFFDVTKHSAMRIYGQSPLLAPNPRQTLITSTPDSDLVFYLQCDFPVALGAPLFSPDGGIIGMTAFKHPKKPHITLVIPPLALEHYVKKAQGITTVDLVETVEGASK